MRDGRVGHWDADDILLGCLDAFANGFWHLASLTHAHTDMALAIADHYYGAETKASAAFDHFGDAVDLNDALLQLKVIRVDSFLCHDSSELSVASCQLSVALRILTTDHGQRTKDNN